AVQPTGQRALVFQRWGFANQHKESGLKGIFGVLSFGKQAAAHAQDQRPVAEHQPREGLFVLGLDESAEQVAIGLVVGPVPAEELTEMALKSCRSAGHWGSSPRNIAASTRITTGWRAGLYTFLTNPVRSCPVRSAILVAPQSLETHFSRPS